MDFCPPRKTGLTVGSVLCVLAFGAFAVPMGQGPGKASSAQVASVNENAVPGSASTERNLREPVIHRVDIETLSKEPTVIENQAVVVSASVTDPPLPLYTRIFKVDPNTFLAGMRTTLGLGQTNNLKSTSESLRKFFTRYGVDLAEPKSVFFNDREGTLLVLATLADLDAIEQAVQVVNTAPPQLQIKTKFIALPDEDAAEFWNNLGNANAGATNRTTILTPAQAQAALKTFKSNPKFELVNEASVTTLSGRQTEIQCVELSTIVTKLNPKAFAMPGVSTNAADTNGLYLTETLPFGPTLDMVPVLELDGWTIELTLLANLTEFLGYDPPSNSVAVYVKGVKQHATPPLPRFHVSTINQAVAVRDGYTVVLGGLSSETVAALKNKVPVLGDVPLLGKLFRSESRSIQKKQMMVFVTPTLIDAAGTLIHSDK